MSIDVIRTLPDGSNVVRDTDDGREFVLKPGQFAELRARGSGRAVLEEMVRSNRADPTDGRTERDEQAMDTARDASSGESHQEQERG